MKFGNNQGTVVDISFRCTKIKTLNNTIVTLPNSSLTSTAIINWSRMEQRRYQMNLKLPLETSYETMETIVNRIRFVLQSNAQVVPDTVQVHFDTIDQTGNNIIIYLYTNIIKYVDFLEFRQEINTQILRVLESENVRLIYPSQNVYVVEPD